MKTQPFVVLLNDHMKMEQWITLVYLTMMSNQGLTFSLSSTITFSSQHI